LPIDELSFEFFVVDNYRDEEKYQELSKALEFGQQNELDKDVTLIELKKFKKKVLMLKFFPVKKLNIPTDGVLIHGLFMEAFRWDDEHKTCVDSLVGEMNPRLPMLHMKPQRGYTPNPKDYISPLYRTSARAGTLSTTGKSTQSVQNKTSI
jgi:dynein heavy chain